MLISTGIDKIKDIMKNFSFIWEKESRLVKSLSSKTTQINL
jgi:hypothetical protein